MSEIDENTTVPPQVHEVVWTKEKISRYWDVFGNIKPVSPWFSVKASGWLLKRIEGIISGLSKSRSEIRIIDMGSGSGEFINFIRQKTGCRCYGIDLSPERIERASATYPEVEFSVGSITGSDLPSESFDLVITTQTVEHLLDEDLGLAFQEFARLLTPVGKLLLTTRWEEDLRIGQKVCPDCLAVYAHSQHLQSFDAEMMEGLLTVAGMRPELVARSRCRNNVHEYIPARFKLANKIAYNIFGNYLDQRIGKYMVAIAGRSSEQSSVD